MTRAADLAKLIAGSSTLGGTGELVLKDVDTADGSSPKITFQTGDTDIAQDDVLGTIDFQAPDEGTGTDAILVSAGVEAKAEGNFSSSSNATSLTFKTGSSEAAAERMRVDSSGNLMIGKTTISSSTGTVGHSILPDGRLFSTRDGGASGFFSRKTDDGSLVEFYKDSSQVGSIRSASGDLTVGTGDTGLKFFDGGDSIFAVDQSDGSNRDNAVDLGYSSVRFKDLYLSGGIYVGGTGSANYLTDYETGTWTPAYTSTSASFSYSSQYGTYIKVGGLVHLQFYLLATASGTTSNTTTITGLPFAVANLNSLHQSGVAVWFSGSVDIRPLFNNSQSAITLWKKGAVAIATADNVSNHYLVGSGTYRAS